MGIDYSELKLKKVDPTTTDTSGGITIPNGEKVGVQRYYLNGAGSALDCFVYLVWDYGGNEEKYFAASINGPLSEHIDAFEAQDFQVTGDGSKKFSIVIDNQDVNTSPIVGGYVELRIV